MVLRNKDPLQLAQWKEDLLQRKKNPLEIQEQESWQCEASWRQKLERRLQQRHSWSLIHCQVSAAVQLVSSRSTTHCPWLSCLTLCSNQLWLGMDKPGLKYDHLGGGGSEFYIGGHGSSNMVGGRGRRMPLRGYIWRKIYREFHSYQRMWERGRGHNLYQH